MIESAQKKYHKNNSWMNYYFRAKDRCTNSNNPSYRNYGGKGIKFKLSKEQIKSLWIRDKAEKLKKPSIDRKDSNKNYTFKNCRFIEFSRNCALGREKTVIQYSLKGHHIRMFRSGADVERQLGFNRHNINRCCIGKRPTAFGYIWRYYDEK